MKPDNPSDSNATLDELLNYHAAPAGLKAIILARLQQAESPVSRPLFSWNRLLRWPIGAAFAGGLAAALLLVQFQLQQDTTTPLLQELVAGHIRSLQVAHLADVNSSDQHTVKPWFAGKLDYSPPVLDFAPQGFALAGGRLDYIGARPVAALVYRYQQHVVNLYIWPAPGTKDAPEARPANLQGFNVATWRLAGMQYWAVSDARAEELSALARLFSQDAASRAN